MPAFLLTFHWIEPSGRPPILSEKTFHPPSRRRRWLLAICSLPLLGFVAAFGIAPDTATEQVDLREVTREIPLPLAAPPEAGDAETYWREETILRGDTVASLLARLQVDDPQAVSYLRGTRSARALYQLVPGRSIRAVTTGEGRLLSLRYPNGDGTELVLHREDGVFIAHVEQIATESRLAMASGVIETSLFAATDSAGLSDAVAVQFADIFSSEIDFQRDLRPGDRFAVVYEALFANGQFLRAGRIVAAEFINQQRSHRAVYFQDPQGRGGYYTPQGKNVRNAFLRSPLEFSRITSGFSLARLHPVLGVWRAHKGIDYGAPVGTRVRATADGVVEFVGNRSSYGNVIILQHANGYSTLYAHLSGFAKGVRAGQRVNQGDLVAYVGMTGLASGPHLHYEFRVDGVHKNPLGLAIPVGLPVGRETRGAFEQASRPLLERLDLFREVNLAAVN